MYHKSVKRNMGLSVLILVLVSLTIGYAIISSNLQLNGNAEIANMAWNIYFDNISVTDGSTGLSVPTLSSDKTSVSFTTSFTEPTDYYDFTLDLINDGTLAAKVDSVTLSGLTTEQDVYANYRVTYVGGGAISAGDTLNPGEVRQVRVRIEMDPDVDATSLPSEATTLSLSAKINFIQGEEVNYLYNIMKNVAYLDNAASPYVTSETGINFLAESSDTNGKGVYIVSSTADDVYPIYYYRGEVDNNVIFGGFCWKIVRTTETGGVKLIYNGTPTDGTCVASGTDTTIGPSKFNESRAGIAFDASFSTVGYMYDRDYYTVDNIVTTEGTGVYVAESVTYENGVYTLVNPIEATDLADFSTYKYTCKNALTSCESVYFAYYISGGSSGTISEFVLGSYKLSGGLLIDVINKSLSGNINDSTIKSFIDAYYEDSLINYQKDLEDTVWCNDRYVKSWGWFNYPETTSGSLTFGAGDGLCSENDSFSVYNENGNGNLKYPIATITNYEKKLSGWDYKNSTNYLYNGIGVWTMSPSNTTGYSAPADMQLIMSGLYSSTWTGQLNAFSVTSGSAYVRPMISLKVGTTYTGGTGTTDDPYIIP